MCHWPRMRLRPLDWGVVLKSSYADSLCCLPKDRKESACKLVREMHLHEQETGHGQTTLDATRACSRIRCDAHESALVKTLLDWWAIHTNVFSMSPLYFFFRFLSAQPASVREEPILNYRNGRKRRKITNGKPAPSQGFKWADLCSNHMSTCVYAQTSTESTCAVTHVHVWAAHAKLSSCLYIHTKSYIIFWDETLRQAECMGSSPQVQERFPENGEVEGSWLHALSETWAVTRLHMLAPATHRWESGTSKASHLMTCLWPP